MQSCYKHPKLHAVIQCRKCKIPVCCHCVQDDYCPDCFKQVSFIRKGQATTPKPTLVETPVVRSRTMDLVIQRLHRQAFDPDAASREKRQARDVIRQVQMAKKKPVVKGRQVVKTREPMHYGFLMPSVSPLVKVTRSPFSRMAAVAVAFFALGMVFAQTRLSYAEPVSPVPVAQPVAEQPAVTAAPAEVTHYKPVYIFVNNPKAAAQAPAAAPAQAIARPVQQQVAYRPATAPAPVSARFEEPRVAVSYPTADSTLSGMGYLQVHVTHPEQVRNFKVMVDDQSLMAADAVGSELKIPFDTTQVENGAHTVKVIATSTSGQLALTPEIPVSILN